jgi:hypothetical protein
MVQMAVLLFGVGFLCYFSDLGTPNSILGLGDPFKQTGVKGKDIVMVVGENGGHALNVHGDLIRANREEYAAFHGSLPAA